MISIGRLLTAALRSGSLAAAPLAASMLFTGTAQAQLIDPNNHCAYLPGSTACQPIQAPAAPQMSGAPYEQFLALAAASGIDISRHGTYTQVYFEERARLYCSLLQQGEMMKIATEASSPPVRNWFETAQDRPRLETAILRIAALNYCRNSWSQEQSWESTFVR